MTEKQNEVLQALATIGPMTNYELRLQLGISKDSCTDVLRRLRDKNMVRICGYEKDDSGAGRPVAVYAEGVGGDVSKPRPMPNVNPTFNAMLLANKQKNLGVWAGLMR